MLRPAMKVAMAATNSPSHHPRWNRMKMATVSIMAVTPPRATVSISESAPRSPFGRSWVQYC